MKQRILSALVATLSLFALNSRLTYAQDTPTSSEPAVAQESSEEKEALTLKAGEKVSSLIVRDRTLVIEGEVTNDVVAFNSDVVIKPGAKVGGHVLVFNGSVKNEAGAKIRPIVSSGAELEQTGEVKVPLPDTSSGTVTHAESRIRHAMALAPQTFAAQKKNNWAGNQFLMLLFGLVGGLVLLIVAPRATEQATDTLSMEPGRCFLVGVVGCLSLLVIALFNAMAVHSPVGLLWLPVGSLIGILSLIVLAIGWLCGMRLVGDFVAKKFKRYDEGHLLGRIALGLVAFCFANLLLHAVGGNVLGGAGLFLEAVVAVMGLGALLVSGFGTNPDWLGARLRGERRWLSRR